MSKQKYKNYNKAKRLILSLEIYPDLESKVKALANFLTNADKNVIKRLNRRFEKEYPLISDEAFQDMIDKSTWILSGKMSRRKTK